MRMTCPECDEEVIFEKSPKPGTRLVCPACCRSFTYQVSAQAAMFEDISERSGPAVSQSVSRAPRAAPPPLPRRGHAIRHVDTSTPIRKKFENSRATGAFALVLVAAIGGYGGFSFLTKGVSRLGKDADGLSRQRTKTVDRYAKAPSKSETNPELDKSKPYYEDSTRSSAPNPYIAGNFAVAVSEAKIDVVKRKSGVLPPSKSLILTITVKNRAYTPQEFNGWSTSTRLRHSVHRETAQAGQL